MRVLCPQFLLKKCCHFALNILLTATILLCNSTNICFCGIFCRKFFKKVVLWVQAKFKNEKLDKNLIWKEIEQVNNTGLLCNKYGFFSKVGYKEIAEEHKKNLILYTLDDLFADDMKQG